MHPRHVNAAEWQQATDYARQACARIYRQGGTPADAVRAFGLAAQVRPDFDWKRAVDRIAEALCRRPERDAA
jgi:hypothetical protein